MSIENSAGLGVNNVYGPRTTDEGRSGTVRTAGVVKELQVDFRGSNYGFVEATLPAGAKFVEGIAKVTEAFVLGGTDPTINIGTSGSAGTNYGMELSEAQAETVGSVVYLGTGAGTWSAPLAAETTVKVELDGTSPTIADGGNVSVVIRYIVV